MEDESTRRRGVGGSGRLIKIPARDLPRVESNINFYTFNFILSFSLSLLPFSFSFIRSVTKCAEGKQILQSTGLGPHTSLPHQATSYTNHLPIFSEPGQEEQCRRRPQPKSNKSFFVLKKQRFPFANFQFESLKLLEQQQHQPSTMIGDKKLVICNFPKLFGLLVWC